MIEKKELKKEIADLVEEALRIGATDIHLAAGRPPILRIDSRLKAIESRNPLGPEEVKDLALGLLSQEQQEKFWAYKDIDLSFSYKETARFRVNIYQQTEKIAVAMRLLPTKIRTLEELNLPTILHQFVPVSQGFFLVVGPSGHGKSTALAAVIDEINHTREDHIITIEDPIEYIFSPKKCIIDQREIGTDAIDFHRALRAMFREDADIVMLGEMRDPETISAAITAAETGHLIFSTLHTNTAAQTIDRIIDTFPPHQQNQIRMQLSSTLLGILSRRLLPSTKGGLINAVELLIVNSAVRNLIREGKIHQIDMVIETSVDEGMISLNRSLSNLIRQGLVSYENAEIFSSNPSELRLLLEK
ncbi:MAG: PilT/PilU family type 4a pilus ATPase [Candidatus Portnoybacteria bacterium]|nr:PilT/PilU family type 4a pilus ATPase [Candidatus Portnoybacteria bacterium]